MEKTAFDAIYENGVFRPLSPIVIKEGERVHIVIEPPRHGNDILSLAFQVYEGLSEDDIKQIEKITLDRRDFFEEHS
jgi:predicted DNA-binding antitoxin AbrB/MazE fold protein